jgi:hypothetical protein
MRRPGSFSLELRRMNAGARLVTSGNDARGWRGIRRLAMTSPVHLIAGRVSEAILLSLR